MIPSRRRETSPASFFYLLGMFHSSPTDGSFRFFVHCTMRIFAHHSISLFLQCKRIGATPLEFARQFISRPSLLANTSFPSFFACAYNPIGRALFSRACLPVLGYVNIVFFSTAEFSSLLHACSPSQFLISRDCAEQRGSFQVSFFP